MIRLLTLLLSLILLTACTAEETGLLYFNVNGYTLSGDELVQFEAIAIENGKVAAIGTDEELLRQYGHFEQRNGDGATMLPGLIDAHAHVMGLGYQEMDVDVAGIRSLDETLEKIRQHAEDNPDLEWIRGRGWNQVLWEEDEFPTAADLDRVVGDRPVWLTRVDGHAGWANTKAMELANITQDTPDVQGGRIIRDENGEATGVFIDAVMRYISDQIPERSEEENAMALQLALEKMAANGITSVHDARTNQETWEMYKQFADDGEMITRIYAMVAGAGDEFDRMAADGIIESYANDLLALRSVKISSDGALGSRGAALLEDYEDESGNKGLLFFDQDELNGMLLKGASNGFQMNIHAIGDAANRQVLDGFEYVREQLGDQSELRHRIEHAQIVHPDDIPRFVDLDLVASMQPVHATSDMNMAEDRVGSERILGGYAWQTFLNQGTVIAGGSDFPVERVNPFYGLHAAVTRQDHDDMPPGGWYSEQAMSRIETLRAFTIDAAYAAHQEEVLGTLEPGKWADFILVDRDFFEVDASEIWQTQVLETWVGGQQIFNREDY